MCMVTDNMGLVGFVVKKYFRHLYTEYSYEELVQVGVIGLIKASKVYDNSRGLAFSTVATKYIWGELIRFERDNNKYGLDRIEWEKYHKVNKCKSSDINEVALQTKLTVADVERVKNYQSVSLDVNTCDNLTLASVLGGDEFETSLTNKMYLEELLNSLLEEDKEIIYLYYFHNMSQPEIARRLNFTQTKVSRRLNMALKQLSQDNTSITCRRRRRHKRIGQFTLNGDLIATFNSTKDASTATGSNRTAIYASLNGSISKTNGYVWKDVM